MADELHSHIPPKSTIARCAFCDATQRVYSTPEWLLHARTHIASCPRHPIRYVEEERDEILLKVEALILQLKCPSPPTLPEIIDSLNAMIPGSDLELPDDQPSPD